MSGIDNATLLRKLGEIQYALLLEADIDLALDLLEELIDEVGK